MGTDERDEGHDGSKATLMDVSYSQFYGDVYRTHWWWRARESNVLHFVRGCATWGGRRAKILDVGCGDGFIWNRLAEFGDVEGIEPDEVLIAPDSPYRDRIEITDVLEGRARGADHDLILMLDVLEHIENEHAALERIRSLLAENGRLVLTVPALQILWSEFDELSGHFRRYRKKTLRAALEKAGFTVLELRYAYAWTVLPLFARKAFFKADAAEHSHFVKAPIAPLNALLTVLSRVDHWISRRVPVPGGSSLIAVAAPRGPVDR